MISLKGIICHKLRGAGRWIGACGFDFSLAGFGYNGKKTLWQEEKVLLKSGDCPWKSIVLGN